MKNRMPSNFQRASLVSIVVSVSLMGCAQETSSNPTSPKTAEMPSQPDVRDIAGVELGKEIVIPECKKGKGVRDDHVRNG